MLEVKTKTRTQRKESVNKTVIGILSALITAFIMWLSYTTYETSVKVAVIEHTVESLFPLFQELTER